jgi:hypothetical protein
VNIGNILIRGNTTEKVLLVVGRQNGTVVLGLVLHDVFARLKKGLLETFHKEA